MVNLMKEGLVNGSLEKRELELGDHLVESTPKFKKRRVSAVRDFPKNCGPNTPLVNSEAEGNDVVTVENDSVGQEVMTICKQIVSVEIDSQSDDVELAPIEKADTSPVSVVDTTVSFATHGMQDITEEMKFDVLPVGLSFPNGVEKEGAEGVKDINTVETFNESVMDNDSDEKANHTLEVGSLINGIDKETKLILEDGSSVQVIGEETIPIFEDVNLVIGADSVDILKDLSPTEFEVNDSLNLDKGKFRRRRISAIRDFPPFCGPNAIRPTGETVSAHLRRDGLVASPVSNLEIALTDTESHGTELLESDLHDFYIEKSEPKDVSEGSDKAMDLDCKHDDFNQESAGKEMVLHSQYRDQESNPPEIAHRESGPYSRMKEDNSAWPDSLGEMRDNKINKGTVWKGKAVAKKSTLGRDSTKRKLLTSRKIVNYSPGSVIAKSKREHDANYGNRLQSSSSSSCRDSMRIDASSSSSIPGRNFEVMLPPSTISKSSASDARNKVKETLRMFHSICRKLLQEKEAKSESGSSAESEKKGKRIDLRAAKMIKQKNKEVNAGKQFIGAVPGVEVGDEFQFRVELAIIGVHRVYQGGIDYQNRGGKLLALSIVASGAYADDMENPDVLIYSGQGGNLIAKNKNPEDQKLERGNLALKNSISERNEVRVIRGSKENKASDSSGARDKMLTTYVYDGLYTVDRYYTETGAHGKMVFMFELKRIPGQPELAWKEVKLSKKFKKRQGVCVDDISGGKEVSPVCAVNTLDNDKPPSFSYITKMMYPDWFRPSISKGCDCTGRCSDSRKCVCAVKNGGEIPYNHNGAIVEAKPIVFECGPACKCPPSCYNRVAQRGPSIQLEIFKTESRGWGVRSLSFIPSGTFICEYTGELLEDKEAEQRTNDEYLFDIGRNANDSSKTEGKDAIDAAEDGGHTIDAAYYGNLGRFVNHSCSPNLYGQDVLYDHEDPKMPHVMLFAADNIPALQELTYDYNYSVGQVRDSNGNIKMKDCYCGSTVCSGRMY
ncbi:histone modifying enzyme [Lithospermum erythrorhizon]|uniref:Histone modifying enzyme n=1 Tax=Lithospermum erythrorhizon TaxID=34254 RepID=A0AAV3PSA4_LITER